MAGLVTSWRENCFLKHVVEGMIGGRIKVIGKWGRRRKQLLDGIKETGGNCKLKEKAIDRTLWRTRSGGDCGPVVRETAECVIYW